MSKPAMISEARTPTEFLDSRRLFEEYAAALGIDLCFQNFAQELEELEQLYAPPRGCLLLAHAEDGETLGCVGLRALQGDLCEMKRLYVRPAARGRGLGRRLAAGILGKARELGYRHMMLDTLPSMTTAHKLYRSMGFRETAPYHNSPTDGIVYMTLDLAAG